MSKLNVVSINKNQLKDLDIKSFNKEYMKFKTKLDNETWDARQSSVDLIRILLAMSLEMLPILETKFHSSEGRNTYQVTTFVTQIRELANDLRVISDNDRLLNKIIEEILDPLSKQFAQIAHSSVMDSKAKIGDNFRGTFKDKAFDAIDKSLSAQLTSIQTAHSDSLESLKKIFND